METVKKNFCERLNRLYPKVDESLTPLPRTWSSKDKFTYLGLSQGDLRVHYKGSGKNHKDAASVRVTEAIPAACGVYYFEIKIISKGRDGYMGIGLSGSGVNLNRLPGWEKNSYGYHADDGYLFSSSGTGQKFGPTFTTGDVVGCGFNLVDRSIFFTKNGFKVGTAVTDIPATLNLYPTVGLQTPGEIVEANFGENPFVFDFEGLLTEMREQVRTSISEYPVVGQGQANWQTNLHKVVLSYLVHHGYSQTAQVFASSTGQSLGEEPASIMNRQRIQSLVLRGKISEALKLVQATYKGLLDSNLELLFRLKCRQFIEMIAGHDRGTSTEPELPSQSPQAPTTQEETATNGQDVLNGDLPQDAMDVDPAPERVDLDQNPVAFGKLLAFGRELQTLYTRISATKPNEQLRTLLQDSFSLLAYTELGPSPAGYLLDPVQRETVCAALNSAILESQNLPGQPPLEFALGQASQCLKQMSANGLGSAAFTGVQDIINS